MRLNKISLFISEPYMARKKDGKPYCGVKTTTGKQATAEECAEVNQIRLYGLKKVDKSVLANKSGARTKDIATEKLKLLRYQGVIKQMIKDLQDAKRVLSDDRLSSSQHKKAQKYKDSVPKRKETALKKIAQQKKVVQQLEEEEKKREKEMKKKKKQKGGMTHDVMLEEIDKIAVKKSAGPAKGGKPKKATAKPSGSKTAKPKKPVAKKPAAKKPIAKKPVAKKPVAKKPAAKKPATKKPAAKKPTTKKPAAKKPTGSKTAKPKK